MELRIKRNNPQDIMEIDENRILIPDRKRTSLSLFVKGREEEIFIDVPYISIEDHDFSGKAIYLDGDVDYALGKMDDGNYLLVILNKEPK